MHICNVSLPSAYGVGKPSGAEVQALINLVRRSASEPGGRHVSLQNMADALGVQRGTLYAWMRKIEIRPGKFVTSGRSIPYTALYCLQVMAQNPAAAREDVFRPMWQREVPPTLDQRCRVPRTR